MYVCDWEVGRFGNHASKTTTNEVLKTLSPYYIFETHHPLKQGQESDTEAELSLVCDQ